MSLLLPALERDVQLPGHSNEIGERVRRHLLHDPASMDLECDLADTERRRRLFVQKSADDQWEHLAFARRERSVALLQLSPFGSLQPCVSVARDGCVHRRHKVPLAEWFRQKVDGAGFDRANRRWNVAVSCDEHDWRVVRVAKLALEIQATDVR